MIIWLKQPDGSCVRLVDPWKPCIHIGGETSNLLTLQPFIPTCNFVEKFERAGNKERSKVLEVEVDDEFEAQTLARRIFRHGGYSKYRLYDVDIPSTQMYLYHNNLFPLAFVEANDVHGSIEWTVNDSREALNYELPPLRTLQLKLCTKKTRRIPMFEDELDSINIQTDNETVTIISGDESDKLTQLVDAFTKIDPDIVLTEGGDSFIFPYLARRCATTTFWVRWFSAERKLRFVSMRCRGTATSHMERYCSSKPPHGYWDECMWMRRTGSSAATAALKASSRSPEHASYLYRGRHALRSAPV